MNIYSDEKLLNPNRIKYRPIQDTEIKSLFDKIVLNKTYPLPEKLIQDFINDGSIEPTLKICTNFTNRDFNDIVIHIKKRVNIKKLPPKRVTKKNKDKKDKKDKNVKNIKKENEKHKMKDKIKDKIKERTQKNIKKQVK
jgi:hypothetical protein|uniref:Uncharacterized protein n=1 Tax=viral metagenome TaxID=1070528 RepID=A0A6C0D4Z8_9ZZZZ